MKLKTIGSIGVDSGQVFITDPCYIKHTEQGNGQWNLDWKEEIVGVDEDGITEVRRYPVSKNDPTLENKQNFYTKVCEANKDGRGGAEVELGVVVATTHGDGEYAVEGIYDDDDQFLGIFIDFHGQVNASFEYNEEW
tara:strand:- start:841 stop:1251 length:411 start_codon:yes stop_codon:yes gene_type:complete